MIVALTGTPGTGKTAVAKHLKMIGYNVISVNDIAKEHDLFTGFDDRRQTYEVNVEALNDYFADLLDHHKDHVSANLPENTTILEGHLAHYIEIVELVIILRCHPQELRNRLAKRDWSNEKIKENIEAEALDVITVESVENFKNNSVFEVDTTNESIENIIKNIQAILKGDSNRFRPGNFNWSEEILKWY